MSLSVAFDNSTVVSTYSSSDMYKYYDMLAKFCRKAVHVPVGTPKYSFSGDDTQYSILNIILVLTIYLYFSYFLE